MFIFTSLLAATFTAFPLGSQEDVGGGDLERNWANYTGWQKELGDLSSDEEIGY